MSEMHITNTPDYPQDWECLKTGAMIKLADRWAYGDLFRLGQDGYLMNVSSWGEPAPDQLYHAAFGSWHQWFGEFEDRSHNVSIVILKSLYWFNYNGQLVL